ncbi:MAG: histidine--tRNA ligase [Candidatus Dormibacteria bacterium]
MSVISAPRGTRDLLPADEPAWEWLHSAHVRVAGAHGYRLVETPMFEATELFERGIGAGTDVVDKEMYTFSDRGGRSLTLRPEGTPAVLRAALSAHLEQDHRPVRLRYAGPMFRYDRPQAGRYREFHQLGIECIGEGSPELDVEVIEVGWALFTTLGLAGVNLQVNSLGDLDDRRRYRAALVAYYTPLREQLCEDCRRRLTINPLRLLDCKRDAGLVAAAPEIAASLSDDTRAYFRRVLDGLTAAGVQHTVNARLVRGLDYYAHTTFEFWHTSLQGAQNALGGGGRYDGLAEMLGFPPTPGVGYALGTERILLVAQEQGLTPGPDSTATVVVASVGAGQAGAAAVVARELRGGGLTVVLDTAERKLERKLRSADRLGASLCCIVGEDEAAVDGVALRDLRSHTQTSLSRIDLVAAVRAALAPIGALQ